MNRPNFEQIGHRQYIVRTQAGFRKAAIDVAGDDKQGKFEVKHMRGNYPTSYPSVVQFSWIYEGHHYLYADCEHVNAYKKHLLGLLEKLALQ